MLEAGQTSSGNGSGSLFMPISDFNFRVLANFQNLVKSNLLRLSAKSLSEVLMYFV